MKLLIDAYNLINYLKSINILVCKGNCIDELVEFLSINLAENIEIVVAIDGFSYPEKQTPENFHLIFSGNKDNADNLIKDKIRFDNKKQILAVVSSDLEVYSYARINAKKAYTSEEFFSLLNINKSDKSEKPDKMSDIDSSYFREAFGLKIIIENNNAAEEKKDLKIKNTDINDMFFQGKGPENSEKPEEASPEEIDEMKKLFGL